MRQGLYFLLQWSWGLPQNLLGLGLCLLLGGRPRGYRGAVVFQFRPGSRLGKKGCFTLGMFICLNRDPAEPGAERLLCHEYGHVVQSALLGPLYLPLAALPSLIWAAFWRPGRRPYTRHYPEHWANRLGRRFTGISPIEW